MKSLVYLMLSTAKNHILNLRRKPGMLILYLGFAALMFWSLYTVASGGHSAYADIDLSGLLSIGWLKLAFLAYVTLLAYTGIQAGLAKGSSFFSMADANLLFTAPVGPKKILAYGLLRQAISSIAMSVFILMMGQTFQSVWGLGMGALFALFGGYVLVLIVTQLLSICLYIYTVGRPVAKRAVVVVCCLCFVPLLVSAGLPLLQGVSGTDAVLGAMQGNSLFALPFIGWVTEAVFALIAGDTARLLLALGLLLAGVLVAVALLVLGRPDYYEDVLVATETAFQRQNAAKEGNMDAQMNTRKVRTPAASGEIRGWGASAFLGKHILEDFRRNQLKIFDQGSMILIITSIILGFLQRGDGSSMFGVLPTTMFMRVFLIGYGLGLRETYSHYIFMVPASSFSKLLWANTEVAVKSLCESLVAYIACGVLIGAQPLEIAASVLVSTLFAYLLVALNFFSLRIFRSIISQGLLFSFYIIMVLVVMAPGVVLGIILGVAMSNVTAGLLALALWELLATLLFFFLARGVLDTCDMETAPQTRK